MAFLVARVESSELQSLSAADKHSDRRIKEACMFECSHLEARKFSGHTSAQMATEAAIIPPFASHWQDRRLFIDADD